MITCATSDSNPVRFFPASLLVILWFCDSLQTVRTSGPCPHYRDSSPGTDAAFRSTLLLWSSGCEFCSWRQIHICQCTSELRWGKFPTFICVENFRLVERVLFSALQIVYHRSEEIFQLSSDQAEALSFNKPPVSLSWEALISDALEL